MSPTFRDRDVAVPLDGRTAGRLEFRRGASHVVIRADAAMPDLVRAHFEGPVPDVAVEGDTVVVRYPRLSPAAWARYALSTGCFAAASAGSASAATWPCGSVLASRWRGARGSAGPASRRYHRTERSWRSRTGPPCGCIATTATWRSQYRCGPWSDRWPGPACAACRDGARPGLWPIGAPGLADTRLLLGDSGGRLHLWELDLGT
jgi:hypothetical protein